MAQPGTQYVVSVKLTADDKEVRDAIAHLTGQAATNTRKIDNVKVLQESFTQIGRAMSGFRHQMRALGQTYQAIRSVAGFGVKDAILGAISINQDLENVEMGLSAVLSSVDRVNAGPFARLALAQREVTRLMKVMRQEAAQTPAEFEGIASSFQVMLPSTRKLVDNLDDVVKLAANASTWDILAGVGTGTTARDFKQILTGHMSMREIQNPMLATQLSQLKKVFEASKELESAGDISGSVAKQREMLSLMIELTKLTPEIENMMANSFTGQKEALVNQAKVLVQEATLPLWTQLKTYLTQLNAWARTPEGAAKLKEYALAAATFLKDAAVALFNVFSFMAKHFEVIKTAFLGFMAIWAGYNVIRFIGALYTFAAAFKAASLKEFVTALLGLKGPGAVASAAGAAGVGSTVAAVAEGAAARSAIISAALVAARVVAGAAVAAVLLQPEGYGDIVAYRGAATGKRASALGMNPYAFGSDALSGDIYANETTTYEFFNDLVTATENIKQIAERFSGKRVIPFNTVEMGEAYPGGPRESKVIKNQIVIDITTGQAVVTMGKGDPDTDIQVNTGSKGVGKGKDI